MKGWTVYLTLLALWVGTVSASAEPPQTPPELRLSLHDAIQAAIDNNVNVRLLKERIAGAQAAAEISLGTLLPNVSGYMTGRNQTVNLAAFGIPQNSLGALGVPGGVTQPFDVYDARASLVQNIFSLSLIQRWRAARTGVDVASLEAEVTKRDVMATAGLLYMEALRAEAALKARQADMELSEQLLKLAKDRKHAGVATRLDVTREEVQVENTRQRLLVAQNDQESAKLNLIRALGIDFNLRLTLTDELTLSKVDLQTPADHIKVNPYLDLDKLIVDGDVPPIYMITSVEDFIADNTYELARILHARHKDHAMSVWPKGRERVLGHVFNIVQAGDPEAGEAHQVICDIADYCKRYI